MMLHVELPKVNCADLRQWRQKGTRMQALADERQASSDPDIQITTLSPILMRPRWGELAK